MKTLPLSRKARWNFGERMVFEMTGRFGVYVLSRKGVVREYLSEREARERLPKELLSRLADSLPGTKIEYRLTEEEKNVVMTGRRKE